MSRPAFYIESLENYNDNEFEYAITSTFFKEIFYNIIKDNTLSHKLYFFSYCGILL